MKVIYNQDVMVEAVQDSLNLSNDISREMHTLVVEPFTDYNLIRDIVGNCIYRRFNESD